MPFLDGEGLDLGTANCARFTAADARMQDSGKDSRAGTDLIRKHIEVAAVKLGLIVLVTCGHTTADIATVVRCGARYSFQYCWW